MFAAAAASRRAFSPAARDAPAVAALILTLPTIFFFAFLYYTDVWGLALLLAADAAAARRAYGVSAAAAAASVLFRQTNAVWACVVVLVRERARSGDGWDGGGCMVRAGGGLSSWCHPARQARVFAHTSALPPPSLTPAPMFFLSPQSAVMREADASRPRGSPALGAHAGPARQLAALLCAAAARPAAVLAPTLPLLAVPVAFVAFVAWNGGVVLGDKSNHAVTLHPAQAAYAAAFAAAALAPAHAAASLPRPTLPGARTLVVAASAATLALTHGVVEHAFLVSDNRHYTFYLWRAFKRSGAGGTAALGVAAGAGGAWVGSLLSAGGAPALWRLGLAAAAALALLPSPLLEFRYFAPLVSLAATRAPPLVGRARLAFALAAFGAVNAGTTYVFLARPFVQNGEVKRFMW